MEEINGLARCEFVVFQKDSFMIAKFKALEDFDNMPEGSFSVKGDMAVKAGLEYTVHATLDSSNQKYKNSYNAIRVASDVDLSGASKSDIEKFLSEVSTPTRAKSIMATFDNPIEILENRDIEALVEAKGITASVASDIIDAYFSQKDYSEAIIEFQKYNLTTKTIINICKQFGSADLAIKMVNDNPYCLSALDGFGFTKADNVFLSDPENRPEDHRRVEAYIKFMFEKEYDEGNTWISPADMIAKLKEFIPMADHKYAVEYVRDSEEFVVERIGEDIHISSREMYNVEVEIAQNLNRLMSAKCTINLSRYKESIRATESVNGWEYDESQIQAIDNMVEKNVYMLQGLGGTGKTATIRAFLNAVEAGGYQFSSCALSGKASQNLTISTGKQGYTIHSLLGASIGGFAYNENMPLQADVVVLDELSMVNMRIFLSLIKAIKSGAKLIMLGDYGQLEAIGVGVMGGLITSKCVPMSLLKKIHRQAQDSAIITHSIAVRNGLLPSGMSLEVDESKVYGVKQDLEYTLVDKEDEDKIFDYAMDKFKLSLEKYPIEDIQIICSTKTTGVVSTYELNKSAQYHYNPYKGTGEQVELGYNDHKYYLRVNDKVINMKNNKLTESPEGIERHIYNGSTGIVKDITVEGKNYSLIIDFDGIGEVVVEGKALNNIQLGYAMTIHKCQGSTIKCVIFALPYHYLLNTKELVYTGMTRASEMQYIITSPRSFKRAIKNTSVKKKKINLARLIADELQKEQIA